MEFIDLLMEKMQEKQVTAYKLCNELEIGQSTFSSWKKGKKPTIEKLVAICQFLEVSSDELLGLEKPIFTPDERDLIETYRKCSRTGKSAVQEMAAFQAARSNLSNCPADEEQRAN